VDDGDATFAGQVKVGASYSLNPHFSLFAEYRWLYVSDSSFTFGSTVAPLHAATSAWRVELGSHDYNMGAVGLRYTV
jgi:predicted porin